jgi:large subunit ribosomal protein L19
MNVLDTIEKAQMRTDLPAFNPGDTVKVHVKIKEGDKERIQVFEGVCIGIKHGGVRTTFTVRKISFGQGVERIFPMHSKTIDKVEIVRHGRVRRAKLYYIRELRGKAARIKEIKEVKEAKTAAH